MSTPLPVVEEHRLSYVEQKVKKCRHFNGTMNACCEAGIRYEDVKAKNDPPVPYMSRGVKYSAGQSMPCWVDTVSMNAQNLDCPKRSLYTREEAEAAERESRESLMNIVTARAAIVEKIKVEGRMKESVQGAIPCPVCKTGKLGFTRAGSYNGHIHACCSTQGCVAWME